MLQSAILFYRITLSTELQCKANTKNYSNVWFFVRHMSKELLPLLIQKWLVSYNKKLNTSINRYLLEILITTHYDISVVLLTKDATMTRMAKSNDFSTSWECWIGYCIKWNMSTKIRLIYNGNHGAMEGATCLSRNVQFWKEWRKITGLKADAKTEVVVVSLNYEIKEFNCTEIILDRILETLTR